MVPEYHRVNQPDRQRHVFEEPVETPEPELREEQPEPRPEPDPEPAAAVRPVETPIPQEEPDPTPQMNVQRREADSAVARQSPSLSQLSRSRSQQAAEATAESRQAPSAESQPAAAQRELAAKELTPRRSESAAQAERPSTQAPGAPDSATRAARLQRSESQQATDLAAAALPRRLAKPTTTPRAETASEPIPSAAQRTSPEALQPANTLAVKQQTTSPQETPRAAPEAPAPLQRQSVARNAPAPEMPQVAQADNPTPNRQPRMTERPSAEQSLAGADSPAPTIAREMLQPQTMDARSSVADAASRSLAEAAAPCAPLGDAQPRCSAARRAIHADALARTGLCDAAANALRPTSGDHQSRIRHGSQRSAACRWVSALTAGRRRSAQAPRKPPRRPNWE